MRSARSVVARCCLSVLMLPLAGFAADAATPAAQPAPAANAADQPKRAGYAVGYNVGQSIRSQGLPLDLDAVMDGIRAGASGEQPRFEPQAMQAALEKLQQDVIAAQQKQIADAAAAAGKYLAENATKPGVIKTASGLQYEVLKKGPANAAPATATSQVTAHYEGKLLDGTVFDSSVARGQPFTTPVGQVIPGWQEALQLMRPGDKWRLHVPPELAYGPQGGGPIPPNSVLIFELELISIAAPTAAPVAPAPAAR